MTWNQSPRRIALARSCEDTQSDVANSDGIKSDGIVEEWVSRGVHANKGDCGHARCGRLHVDFLTDIILKLRAGRISRIEFAGDLEVTSEQRTIGLRGEVKLIWHLRDREDVKRPR